MKKKERKHSQLKKEGEKKKPYIKRKKRTNLQQNIEMTERKPTENDREFLKKKLRTMRRKENNLQTKRRKAKTSSDKE